MTAKRRITKAKITFISLVGDGANQKKIIWKTGEEPVYSNTVAIGKMDEDQHMVYGIVYAPEQVDSQGDIADAGTIREMAYSFMKDRYTTNVDKQHDFTADEGYVAESWLIRKNDPLFKGEPEGSWAVGIKVEKEDTWQAVKKGELAGISMAGFAKVEDIPAELLVEKSLFDRFIQWIGIRKGDFDSNLKQEKIRQAIYSLERALDSIQSKEDLDDAAKKKATLESVDQFRAYLAGETIEKSEDSMNEDILKAIEAAVANAVKSVVDRLDVLEKGEAVTKAVNDAVKSVVDRLEIVEKTTPGSQLVKGTIEKEKSKGLSLIK